MNIRPIRTESDYKAALRELSAYFDNEPTPGSEDGDRFEIIATLVEAYEAKHFPIEVRAHFPKKVCSDPRFRCGLVDHRRPRPGRQYLRPRP